ncbi:MAG: fibronectin type III domain-containing protein [Coriobacteriales bacterium]|nr:fibronectin type III domain-containing protein [Coriobacteriales bacterium]
MSAHIAGGWGAPANSVETYAPSVAPDAPSIESVSPGDSSLAVSFIPPAQDGGAAIDAYCVEYSTNGVSWTNATTNAASSPYTIYGLTNGTAYYVRVCAHNVNGNGPYAATGAATAPIAPRTVPSSPTINNVDVGDSSLVVFFLAPIKSGGAVVDAYEVDYSPDGSTWTTASDNVVSSPYTIDGLTNGTAYYVRARAHNAVGWSQYATSSDAYIPLDVPGAPTINNVVPGNGTLTLYFSSPSQNGGADIDKYRIGYRATDNDTWTYCQSELMLYGAVNITDLANGTAYYVCIAAHNAKGYGPAASTSYTNSAYTPLTVPDAPSIVSVMQQAESLVLCFNPPAFNGGADIDAYMVEYSTDAVTWQACMDIVTQSPYTLNGPVSGASYYVRVFAHNQAGLGAAAQTQSAYQLQDSAQTNVPEPPGITSVVPADNALNVYFQTVQANDAYRIEYSATGRDGDWQEATANAVSSPYAIDGLTNGTAYYVRVRAHNQYGWGQAATTQERYVPSTRPDPPMGISVACGNSLLSVMFTAPAYDGNAAVDKYRIEYSVSLDGPWMSCATEPVSAGAAMNILNLANGTPYYIRVCAHNLNGYGEYATTQDAYTPSTVPGAPIISNVRPGDRHIAVSFSGAELNGGAQIDAYGLEYSVADTNEWHIASITIDPSQGEYAIDGLTNGTAYYIRMAAHNQNGWGDIAKDNVTYTPFTAPTPPTITKVVPGDNSLIVYYTAPENDGGSPIDHYDIEYAEANTLAPGSLTASVDASSIDHISASDLEFARRVVEAVAHSNTAHSLATPLGADEPIWKVAASNIPITDREGSYEITGLTGGVPYLVRLVAYNEGGAFSYNNADVDAGNTPYVPIVPPLGSTPSPPLGEGEQPENQPADVVYDTGTSYYANNNDLRESDDLYDDEVGLYYSHIKRDYDKSSGAGADNDADATGSNANRHLPYMGNGTGDIDVDAMLSDAGLMVYGWAAIVIAASVFIIVGIIVAIKVRYRKRWYTSLTSK